VNWAEFSPTTLLRRVVEHGVDFVVVGGIAMVAHGSARLTQDLDLCFAPDLANLEALGAALLALAAWVIALRSPSFDVSTSDADESLFLLIGVSDEVPFVPDEQTLARLSVLTVDTTEGPLDLLREPAGAPPYAELRSRAIRITLDGVAVMIASLDDLAAMKRATGRPKDLLDLEELDVIRRLRSRGGI